MIGASSIGSLGLGYGSSVPAPVAASPTELPMAEIALLVEISLAGSGPTLMLSDRRVELAGTLYEAFVDEVAGIGASLSRADSGGLNADVRISLLGDPYAEHSHLALLGDAHPFESALCVIRQAHLDATGGVISTSELFRGALDEPRSIGPLGFTLSASSIERSYDRLWS